ncbi:hypothetical protein BON30_19285 [Cystobacter ferrugineus]|uniref:Glycoside hydrolase 123 catalytic domain-containing protein n=1 Tax=Cystobacter ferrugineus TaxID=83449 RepID=A0A1L9BBZ9_9BACT|nr:hypothetical protein BON30_19285 [Cystobacter ferrugineus]
MGMVGWWLAGMMTVAPAPRVVSALEKVRPGVSLAGEKEARLSLARGECEGAQVVLPPGVSRVQVAPLALRGPGTPLEASVWREEYLEVKTPSNSQGGTGAWPDPLVPVEAPRKNAQAPLVLYVELCAPKAQRPGTYQGALKLDMEGAPAASVPFTAEVQPFVLPTTSSLPNSFGISLYSIAKGHGLKPESPEAQALLRDYVTALLAHRVSAHGMSMEPPPVRFEEGRAVLDFRAYDAEVGPFLDGSALPSGARFTTVDVRDSKAARTDEQKAAYYRAFAEHAKDKGWPAQLFFYAKDEPKPEDVPLVRAQALRVRTAGKDVPVLVTSPLDEALRGSADILAPTLNCFFPRPGPQTCRNVVPLQTLRGKLAPNVKVWWYQSCNSHGCTGGPAKDAATEKAYSGWASYMVDHPAPLNRAMGPLAFLSGVDGELYFDTVFAYNTKDPWKDVFEFGGNGDGTFFYPGTPARTGLSHHQPVVSLRLKHLRDGLEDYEYLQLLESLGERSFAREAARRLTRSGYEVELNGGRWEQVRREMTARLRQRWNAAEEAKRSGVRPK